MSDVNELDVETPSTPPSPDIRFKMLRTVTATASLFILFVLYLCVGAAIFVAIEGREPEDGSPRMDIGLSREMFLDRLVVLGNDPNATKADYRETLRSYENHHSYYEYWHQWSYEMSLFYCFKLLTTIGYGSITPVTTAGKLLSIVYAFFGIILLFTFLANIGSLLAKHLTMFYQRLRMKMARKSGLNYRRENLENDQLSPGDGTTEDSRVEDDMPEASPEDVDIKNDLIPFWFLTIFSCVFLLIFSALIYALEDWTYVSSIYFSFMSLATVGFGDYVPEKNLLGCMILIANAFIVVATLICLGYASIMRVIMTLQGYLDKAILKCLF